MNALNDQNKSRAKSEINIQSKKANKKEEKKVIKIVVDLRIFGNKLRHTFYNRRTLFVLPQIKWMKNEGQEDRITPLRIKLKLLVEGGGGDSRRDDLRDKDLRFNRVLCFLYVDRSQSLLSSYLQW